MAPSIKAAKPTTVETTTVPPAETGTVPTAETTTPPPAETRQEPADPDKDPDQDPDQEPEQEPAEPVESLRKVRMIAKISGTRNGIDWPEKGEIIELPTDEARTLIDHGQAEDIETATAETATVETATPTGRRSIKATLDKGNGDS